jgi:hypothetical protein
MPSHIIGIAKLNFEIQTVITINVRIISLEFKNRTIVKEYSHPINIQIIDLSEKGFVCVNQTVIFVRYK